MATARRVTGTVKWFNPEKRYGFIRPDEGPDVFVHQDDIRGAGTLAAGDRVEFTIIGGPRGPKASDVGRLVS